MAIVLGSSLQNLQRPEADSIGKILRVTLSPVKPGFMRPRQKIEEPKVAVRELGLSGHIFTRAYRQLLPITCRSSP